MKFILGTKQHMTQVFNDAGKVIPVTVLTVSPNVVTYLRTKERDGYSAAQVGAGSKREKNISKAVLGHLKGKGTFAFLREFRPNTPAEEEAMSKLAEGAALDVDIFAPGDKVQVSAISKAKGFQGVVKRHKFKGDSRTHGRKHSERAPGSIGGGGRAGGRVIKGMRMGGRMGADRVTVKNLRVVAINKDNHELLIGGAVPGHRGTLVEIRSM